MTRSDRAARPPRVRRRTPALACLAYALACLALAGCGGNGGSGADPATGSSATATTRTTSPEAPRIVSIGGNVTEILYALGVGDHVVAVDRTSVYPDAVKALPQVGMPADISFEGIAAVAPTLVVADGRTSQPVLDQLAARGVHIAKLADEPTTADGAAARITKIGAIVGKAAEAAALVQTLRADVKAARDKVAGVTARPRAMFVYARGHRTLLVAGDGTPAKTLLELAGGENAVTGFDDFKPMSAETVLAAKPELIVIPKRGLASLGGVDGLLALPGMAETPAGRDKRVVAIDDLELLGFGPRMGKGLGKLAAALHPERFATP